MNPDKWTFERVAQIWTDGGFEAIAQAHNRAIEPDRTVSILQSAEDERRKQLNEEHAPGDVLVLYDYRGRTTEQINKQHEKKDEETR